ncbi:Hpt domain-containing protein [Pelomonas sp. KK5]|uniref:hybrid sensor histidine kinase/response regulator n=1 Tax=Pelomonas sp. KK5 TaxID=1855730 RepID=UPI00097BD9D8|nr:Hpt domain-containing protein [Pelomonas sp. KK5]
MNSTMDARDSEFPADLSPLAWVEEELRRSLETVHKTLRRQLRDGDTRMSSFAGTELQPSGALQSAAQQLHQVAGVLSLVGLPAGATLLRASEVAVENLAEHPASVDLQAVETIERADFALMSYIARALAGNKTSTLALFPAYRELQAFNHAERAHPADLWQKEFRWLELPADSTARPLPASAARAAFEAVLLKAMREQSPTGQAVHARTLSELCAALAAGLPPEQPRSRTLWQLAAAVYEAQSLALLPVDAFVKRLGSRLLAQLRLIAQGDGGISEQLAGDLLFFCAQVQASPQVAPRLAAVQFTYELGEDDRGNYEDDSLGRIDPNWVLQARRRVASAKESWSSAAEGDTHRLAGLDEQFAQLSESLARLFPRGEVLGETLQRAVVGTLRSGKPPHPALAMEVATSLLYIDAALDDAAFDQPEQAQRVDRLARRVENVAHGEPPEALEAWMEDLYRRVSDRQTLGSVVHELRASLSEIEREADEYFRTPARRELLIPVPGQLQAMRGVLTVLGLSQAAQACLRMRDEIDELANTEVDPQLPGPRELFERLANNLGALGFMIDMLSVQPALAKRMFRFDEASGRLDPLMGRRSGARRVPAVEEPVEAQVEVLAEPELLEEVYAPAPAALELPPLPIELPSLELDLPPPAPEPAPQPAPAPSVAADPEMLEIFLEEAAEVLGNAREAMAVLRQDGSDRSRLTDLRRAFHTLKGSGRMVGLTEFGEGAWACEQLFNARLAEPAPQADAALLDFTGSALDYLGNWVEQIAGRQGGHFLPDPLRRGADALRLPPEPQEEPAPAEAVIEVPEVAEIIEPAALDEFLPEPALTLDLPPLSDAAPAPAPVVEAAPLPAEDEPFVLDLTPPELQTTVAMHETVDLPDFTLDLDIGELEPAPPAPAPAPHLALVPPPEPQPEPVAAEADAEAAEEDADASSEDGIKVIGPLRISITLFNIFLNEADELSRRLGTTLAEWALELSRPVPPASESLAHALAGNAGTVGYDDLSALARALEHALGRAQHTSRYSEAEAQMFVRAAEDIRHLLHQFAAGFLKPHDAALVAQLNDYVPAPEPQTLSPAPVDLPPEAEAEPEPVAMQAPLLDMPSADADEVEPGLPDQIDPELFPIFEEEARDLLRDLHGALREWAARPGDQGRAAACMRALHTFKGGARLCGAMRLGEQAHELESAIERVLGKGDAQASDLHALQDAGDALETGYEHLSQTWHAAPSAAAVAIELAEPEPLEDGHLDIELEISPEDAAGPQVDWAALAETQGEEHAPEVAAAGLQALVRVRGSLLERMAAQAGEVSIRRSRLESELAQMKSALLDLDDNLDRLRGQLRELEVQAEAQMGRQQEAAAAESKDFDPLEFDRYTRFQELTRMLAESVNDVATVQRSLQRNVQLGEDELAAQSRLTRELQDDLLRTRMVEFDTAMGERMHRVVRQAARDAARQVKLEIVGGQTELDRSVLERMAGAFEHLLRNSVSHGIELPELRAAIGKEATGTIRVQVRQEGNEVLLEFGDDGQGLDLDRIRERGLAQGLIKPDETPDEKALQQLIFAPGFSTAGKVTELSGRGVGMDVVRAEVSTLGGSIETASTPGQGTRFLLRLPLTTALTQIVVLRCGEQTVAVPASLMESVQRLPAEQVEAAYASGQMELGGQTQPFYWLGGLMGQSDRGVPHGKTLPVVLVRSAQQRLALHVDEVMGNQEVVVKNLGPQLHRVPGLAGISLLASGDVALIYNPVALASWYGAAALERVRQIQQPGGAEDGEAVHAAIAPPKLAPLIFVVDDSLTVRRVTQRLLEREGYRVQLAKDGMDAMEKLAGEELPALVLSDIEMPRMDGFDLVRNMRSDPRLNRLPVIMITSRIAQKHRDYAGQLGVDHYLGKPYDEEHLLGLIQRYTSPEHLSVM